MYPMYFQNHYMTVQHFTVKTYYLRGGHLNQSVIVFRVFVPDYTSDPQCTVVELEHWSADPINPCKEAYPSFHTTINGVTRHFTLGRAVVSDVAREVWKHFTSIYTEKDIERDLFPFVAIRP